MTKEELIEKLKEIENLPTQKERVAFFKEINAVLKKANDDLRNAYRETKKEMEQERIEHLTATLKAT